MISAFDQALLPVLYGVHVVATDLAFRASPKNYRTLANIRDITANVVGIGMGISQLARGDPNGLIFAYGMPQATLLGRSGKVRDAMVNAVEIIANGSYEALQWIYGKVKSCVSVINLTRII